ncbi:MAG: hypothetical protein H7263_03530, partial [Candidatus Sericytochromatia bacterium]|nr:hypothetical protein [Candidatus Sericytochromatia bacterium]
MASRSKIAVTLLGLYFGILCSSSYAADTKVKYSADTVTRVKEKIVLKGNVKITVDEVDITGEEIDLDATEKIVSTDKPFKIHTLKEGKNTEINGKSFIFNIDTKRLVTKFASLETDADSPGQKVYISGEEITLFNKGERVSVINGDFTTCEYIEQGKTPHYSLKATKMDFIPNDRLIAWNTSIYTGGNKVFWYPLWYIPLKSNGIQSLGADIGKNETEGTFINFRGDYTWNDYHDGNWFARVMEKKYLGLGFDHTWLALPTSQSYLFAYGNPVNQRYLAETNADNKKNINPFFEDKQIYLEHKQWLPFLPYAETKFTTDYKDFYNVGSLSTNVRENYNRYDLDFADSEIYQPFRDTVLKFNPRFNANYEKNRTSVLNQQALIVPTQVNNALTLTSNNTFKINEDINFGLSSTLRNTIGQTLFNPT